MTGLVLVVAGLLAQAPALPVPTPGDFGQWERLTPSADRGGLSPDGRWMAYAIARTNREDELRVTGVADRSTKAIAFGSRPAFSADSKWLAAAVGYSEAQQEKMRRDKKPIHNKLALLNLTTGNLVIIDSIESFAFSADGHQLLMRHYAPERPERRDPDPVALLDPDDTPGATAVVRDLTAGRDTTLGNVSDAAWQSKGRLLALTIAAEDRLGDGVQLFDPANGSLRVLDSAPARYLGLAWRKDADDLAVLRSVTDPQHEGANYSVLAWTGLGASGERRHDYEPSDARGLGAAQRLVAFRHPSWSSDGRVLFLGVAAWPGLRPGSTSGQTAARSETDTDEPAQVDVWHPHDVDVMPKQKIGARRDRERSLLAAWAIDAASVTVLGRDPFETVVPLAQPNLAYAVSWKDDALERSWGRFIGSTISLVDVRTGTRRQVVDRADDRFVVPSPDGKFIVYYVDGQFFSVDTAVGTIVSLTKAASAASLVDRESDSTDVERPPFGAPAWTTDDAVLVPDKYDVWMIQANGSKATRLTNGAPDQVRYRYARVDPDAEAVDCGRPIYFDLFGPWTKKSGVARLQPGAAAPDRLVWLDRSITRLAKAKDADVYDYVSQSADVSPNVFAGHADLSDARQISDTNPFQSRFAWSRTELIEFRNERGVRLQGVLHYPNAYEPGRQYPMIVYVYEKLSDTLHQYSAPSERDYYNASAFTSAGYFYFEPDIVFRPREPGLSVVECVRPAVAAVVQKGLVDPKKVGIMGHSWGGFDASFLATHTTTFAAAVAGAPITDLVSNYGSHHFSSGIAETDHIETGQQRMEVPVYEDLAAYTRNSALFGVPSMTTPLLIEVGDADGTVFWHQGVELYNSARRAKKNVVLLVYANEDHGLRQKADQLDYHRRILQWFDHYLKGDAAAPWITDGVSFLDHERATPRKSGSQ